MNLPKELQPKVEKVERCQICGAIQDTEEKHRICDHCLAAVCPGCVQFFKTEEGFPAGSLCIKCLPKVFFHCEGAFAKKAGCR